MKREQIAYAVMLGLGVLVPTIIRPFPKRDGLQFVGDFLLPVACGRIKVRGGASKDHVPRRQQWCTGLWDEKLLQTASNRRKKP